MTKKLKQLIEEAEEFAFKTVETPYWVFLVVLLSGFIVGLFV